MSWELKETDEFQKEFNKLPNEIKARFELQFQKVEENPYGLGKPLGYKWFRELKNEGYRVYYLIYDTKIIVLFVGVSDKRSQQDIINVIKRNLRMFKDFIENQ